MVEWRRRLDDFDSKGWHNRVEVLGETKVQYVGLTNREEDAEDRAVLRIEAKLKSYVLTEHGVKIRRTGESDNTISLTEYWTLARRNGGWTVVSIEQRAEGDHQLDAEIVASPWAGQWIADEALTEVAVADKLPEGFKTADLADFAFGDDARAKALDLSLAEPALVPTCSRRRLAARWRRGPRPSTARTPRWSGWRAVRPSTSCSTQAIPRARRGWSCAGPACGRSGSRPLTWRASRQRLPSR